MVLYVIILNLKVDERLDGKMKHISKKLCFTLSSLLVLGSFSGCGKSKSKEETGTAGDAETTAAASADDILTDTIEINRSDSYSFDHEEVMFLSGVELSANNKGVKYTLRDMNEDEISELFISVNGTVGVYAYDEATDSAKKTTDYDKDIDTIVNGEDVNWIDDTQWVDGSIYGVPSQIADPGVKNDYYTSTNYEWLTQTNVSYQGDSVAPVDNGNGVEEHKNEMFEDRDKYQGDDIQRVRDYYDIATNWDKREADGVEPVKKYLSAVEGISSLDGMSDFLANPEINPFCQFMTFNTTLDLNDTSQWIVTIQGDNFSILPRIYHNSEKDEIKSDRKDFDVPVGYVLSEAGYTEQDINRIIEETYEIEDQLLDKNWPNEGDDENDELLTPMPLEDLSAKCENFPLSRVFEAYGMTKGSANVEYPEYLRTLDSLYTEENLPKLKSYCLSHIAYEASSYTTLEAKNAIYANATASDATENDAESAGSTKEELEDFYQGEFLSGRGILGVATENAYMTYFVDDEKRDDITEMANQIKDSFREILENEDWLSDEGKKAAIAKLDNMEFNILKPDEFIDSSYLAVDTESCFLDAYATLTVNTKKHMGELVGQERVKGAWRYDVQTDVTTTVNNCFYYGVYNQFFILDGFLNDGTYRKDMSQEEKLATLGEVIGHELTHGFDPNGIKYDKDGNMVVTDENPYGWMPEEDYNAYTERAERLANYFSKFIPYPYDKCDGTIYQGEAAADISGMRIGLKIASKTEGFDYDKYFRTHSSLWVKQTTLISERSDIFGEHPLDYLRINATCQQFQEFYDTYDIKEGDGMYLAPEERISIW